MTAGRATTVVTEAPFSFIDVDRAPVQIIDTANMTVLAGPKGLKPGDELTVCVTLTPFPPTLAFVLLPSG